MVAAVVAAVVIAYPAVAVDLSAQLQTATAVPNQVTGANRMIALLQAHRFFRYHPCYQLPLQSEDPIEHMHPYPAFARPTDGHHVSVVNLRYYTRHILRPQLQMLHYPLAHSSAGRGCRLPGATCVEDIHLYMYCILLLFHLLHRLYRRPIKLVKIAEGSLLEECTYLGSSKRKETSGISCQKVQMRKRKVGFPGTKYVSLEMSGVGGIGRGWTG